MAAERKRKRRYGNSDAVFALGKQFTLAPIAQADEPPARGAALLLEPAWDGLRVLAPRAGDEVRLAAADLRDWTPTFPGAARALGKLGSRLVAIDGVVCVLDARGTPSFDDLRAKIAGGGAVASGRNRGGRATRMSRRSGPVAGCAPGRTACGSTGGAGVRLTNDRLQCARQSQGCGPGPPGRSA